MSTSAYKQGKAVFWRSMVTLAQVSVHPTDVYLQCLAVHVQPATVRSLDRNDSAVANHSFERQHFVDGAQTNSNLCLPKFAADHYTCCLLVPLHVASCLWMNCDGLTIADQGRSCCRQGPVCCNSKGQGEPPKEIAVAADCNLSPAAPAWSAMIRMSEVTYKCQGICHMWNLYTCVMYACSE